MPETSEKLVGELNEIEFNALIERFIERETEGTGEVPAEVLFEALPDFWAAMAESASLTQKKLIPPLNITTNQGD